MKFLIVMSAYGRVPSLHSPFCPGYSPLFPLAVCRLFRERLDQVKVKLDEVLTGKAGEYREPLATLQKNMQLRTQVAGNNNKQLMFFKKKIKLVRMFGKEIANELGCKWDQLSNWTQTVRIQHNPVHWGALFLHLNKYLCFTQCFVQQSISTVNSLSPPRMIF